ncbi:molybdopterin synthase small subunit [Lacunisphaera limnophila]|uniref:Molybdopterin synthase sulfur carrier subunit n=1 Tax=Lacunisphaera limnophila TaxID=1838286 RepID=A0A1D8AV30_9BACT|nr:MoaD/ThiS family protein [Lacunisphaera limnophila]AOS44758.1 molybdopterin synthase small subunit [Lacunisphaera limnophila]
MSRPIHVRFFAILREQAGVSTLTLDTVSPDAATLYAELQGRCPGLTFPVALLKVSRNEAYVDLTTPLAAGDRVVFIPPVAGG